MHPSCMYEKRKKEKEDRTRTKTVQCIVLKLLFSALNVRKFRTETVVHPRGGALGL
jgi:hypothetical protein